MEQGKGTISENDLMMKLAGAKQVMNAVDTGKYQGSGEPPMNVNIPDEFNQTQHLNENIQQPPKNINVPVNGYPMNEEKIRNSKLPDAIKKAMIENPIEQPSMNSLDNLDMKIFEGAKRLMKEENVPSRFNQQPGMKKQTNQSQQNINANDLASTLAPIIENVVRKVLDEKLTQILSAHDTGTINENLAIKVGDSIFHGKITKVKNTK